MYRRMQGEHTAGAAEAWGQLVKDRGSDSGKSPDGANTGAHGLLVSQPQHPRFLK